MESLRMPSTGDDALTFRATGHRTDGVEVMFGFLAAGTLSVLVFRPGNCCFGRPIRCLTAAVECDDTHAMLQWSCPEQAVTAVVQLHRCNTGWVGTFAARGCGHAVVRMVWELPADKSDFCFVPSFMYGNNAGGRSAWAQYPQLAERPAIDFARPWAPPQWYVRADRSSHGMTSLITADHGYALGGRDVCRYDNGTVAEKNGLGTSSTTPRQLSFSLGFANIPFTYCAVPGRNFTSRPEGYVNLDRGPVACELFLLGMRHEGRHDAASRLLRSSYSLLHDPNDHEGDVDTAVTDVAEALVEYGYSERAQNFRSTFTEDRRNTTHDPFFASGWAGGAQVAYPLLLAGHRFNRQDWLTPSRAVLDNLAQNAVNPRSTLFYDNFDLTRNAWNTHGWWYDALENPGHSGYVNGQVCYYLLQAYSLEKTLGLTRTTWLDSARCVLNHVVAVQAEHGGFGYTYDEDTGDILDADGFSGAWFIPALVVLHHITNDKRYLDAAVRAMNFYRKSVDAFCVYGGPHDVFKSPDAEGILAWIRAAHLLHQTTADERFLQDLVMGLEYEFSWKFAYNVVHEHEPLKSMNWRSTGGSVTSVNNPHIHPMNSMITSSLRYAVDATGDDYLRSRLDDTTAWTLSVAMRRDGQFGWGKRGMINERYCHTDALLLERFADGRPASTWFCGHSWASGSVLEAWLG